MEPFTLLSLLWMAANALVLIYIAILYFSKILSFFKKKEHLKDSDKENIAFSLQEKLENGKYETVYGIFNKRTNEVLDGERVSSSDIDQKLEEYHAYNELVVYN